MEKTSRKEAGDLAGEELEKDRRARASEGGKAAAASREAPGSDQRCLPRGGAEAGGRPPTFPWLRQGGAEKG